jgi:hypothetical protein
MLSAITYEACYLHCKDCCGVCVCVCVLQDAGTLTGEAEVGPSPSIQSLSAIQAGPGGPHSRKNSERDTFSDALNIDRLSTGADISSIFDKYGYKSGGLGSFLDENGQ